MTAKQILDAFSETLMQDERILSPRERELLMSLLQNSRAVSSSNPETQSAVNATIARSVGETVAQRAFALLGGSIVEQILVNSGIPAGTEETTPATIPFAGPPSGAPQPPQGPGPHIPTPQPPAKPLDAPQPPQGPGPHIRSPQPPAKPLDAPQPPQGPQPPGPGGMAPQHVTAFRPLSVPVQQEAQPAGKGVGVLDAPAIVRAQSVVLDEFLAPQELDELISYALQQEAEYQSSGVVSPSGDPGVIDYNHRRSRVLMDLGNHEQVILERIRGVLPSVLDQLGIEEFPVTRVEAQITASNDGDFFGAHSDDSHELIASRRLTFVYFFHREPRQFEGGELRLHDSRGSERPVGRGSHQTDGYQTGGYQTGSYQKIEPQQNQIVFFPCSLLHEITPVECTSRAFADSRFTLNGWLHN
jgi:Rps23 Pro-64 3,4-dihydroxylase Tpa1-like proline 4-hydroxylase